MRREAQMATGRFGPTAVLERWLASLIPHPNPKRFVRFLHKSLEGEELFTQDFPNGNRAS